MKRSRPSRPYISVPKLRIKAAKKQHNDGEAQEHNVEDASENDDVLEETSESDDVAETPERDDVMEDASENDDVSSESDDVAEETSEGSIQNEVCMNTELSKNIIKCCRYFKILFQSRYSNIMT
jgi:hypothetical protein